MMNLFVARIALPAAAGLFFVLGAGCSALRQTAAPPPGFYALDDARTQPRPSTLSPTDTPLDAPTLIINPPHAVSGYDSQRIIYVREAHKLEYFAHSEWVDTPARMLAPLIVAAVEASGAFRAVVLTPSAATGELRLDTEMTRLHHDFSGQPSRVRFTLRAMLVDNRTRRIVASHEFDETVTAPSETPYGGVVAANLAVQTVLEQLASFCAEALANRHSTGAEAPKLPESIPAR